jgi:hypothetical protein
MIFFAGHLTGTAHSGGNTKFGQDIGLQKKPHGKYPQYDDNVLHNLLLISIRF